MHRITKKKKGSRFSILRTHFNLFFFSAYCSSIFVHFSSSSLFIYLFIFALHFFIPSNHATMRTIYALQDGAPQYVHRVRRCINKLRIIQAYSLRYKRRWIPNHCYFKLHTCIVCNNNIAATTTTTTEKSGALSWYSYRWQATDTTKCRFGWNQWHHLHAEPAGVYGNRAHAISHVCNLLYL